MLPVKLDKFEIKRFVRTKKIKVKLYQTFAIQPFSPSLISIWFAAKKLRADSLF